MNVFPIGRTASRARRLAALPLLAPGRPASRSTGSANRADEVLIRVRGGYDPDTVFARAGQALRLTFRREETAACSQLVVFPAFGKSAMLPAYRDVTIELLPQEAGEYEFTCAMGMLRGRLIVSAAGETVPAGSEANP